MASRTPKQWLGLGLRGMAMGAADLVPGVSGGTVAFIVGIETDNGSSHFTEAFNHVALALFAFECVVKIIAQAITPQTPWERALGKYFSDNWNKVHPNENPATVIMSQPNHHNPSPSAAIAFFKTKKSS